MKEIIKNRRFYYLLKDYIEKNGNDITPKELAYSLNISLSSVYIHLNKLEKQGIIKRKKNYIEMVADKK